MMRDLFAVLGITLGVRMTPKQKNRFLQAMEQAFTRANQKLKTTSAKLGFHNHITLWAGDAKKAKTIVVSHYDTAARMLVPGFCYSVMDQVGNQRYEKMNGALSVLGILVLFAAIVASYIPFRQGTLVIQIIIGIVDVILLLVIRTLTRGLANPINYNNNSGGVILSLLLALNSKKQKATSYVWVDGDAVGNMGTQQMLETLGKQAAEKRYIFFKAIAYGEQLYVICTSESEADADALIRVSKSPLTKVVLTRQQQQNSLLANINRGLIVTAGSMKDGIVYADHVRTKKDNEVDIPRLERLYADLEAFLQL